MNTVILTSYLDFYSKDLDGNKIPHNFGNVNGILDTLKQHIKQYDNFLFVGNGFDDELIVPYFNNAVQSFEMTLPFKNYHLLSNTNHKQAQSLVEQADFIFLCGGHLPTQNKFFADINLKALLQNTSALICGGSAGSMNCATTVYCPPEVEGESLDPNFKRYFAGLGLTDINILPHYDEFLSFELDGKDYIKDIIVPDSIKTKIYALNNGSYITIDSNGSTLYGEAYVIDNLTTTKICSDDQSIKLQVNHHNTNQINSQH